MAAEEVTHKGHKIEVHVPEGGFRGRANEPGEAYGLYIDGQFIATDRDESGRFWTRRLPYQDFVSLTELGKALIDNHQV